MASRPNTYNPAAAAPKSAGFKDKPKGFLTDEALSDSWGLGWMGQSIQGLEREGAAWQQEELGFDYREHIPEGYENFADAFAGAHTMGEILIRKRQLDENIAMRQRRDARGGWSTFASDLVTGTLDPVNLIGGGVARGAGFLAGAGKGALAIGGAGAASEVLRGSLDPTSTPLETAAGIFGNLGLGATIGGIVGMVPRGAAAGTKPLLARTRAYINPENAAAVDQAFRHVVQQESSGGKNIIGIPTKVKGGKTVQAFGAAQVIDSTAKAMAEKIGLPWNPKLMREKTPEGYEYQVAIGRAYFQEGLQRYGGDLAQALAYYHGGPDRTQWGPKTRKYVNQVLTRIGYGEGALQLGGNPVQTLNALEMVHVPEVVEAPDGRGLPVSVGPTGTGAMATFVRPKDAGEIAGEVALEEAQSVARASDPHKETSIFDGLSDVRHTDVPNLVKSWTRRAAIDREFRQQLGFSEAPTLQDVDGVVTAARKQQLIDKANQQLADGTFPLGHERGAGDGVSVPGERSPLQVRRGLQRQIERLTARAKGLEAAILRHGDGLNIPMTQRRVWDPNGKRWRMKGQDFRPADEVLDGLDDEIGRLVQELEEAGGPVDPDIAAGELTAGRAFADEADLFVDMQHAGDNVDEDLALLNAEERKKQERDLDSGELADELPFGMAHGEAEGTQDGAHFRIDVQAILNSFADRPWSHPRLDGVEPFPEDAFHSPGEWLNFVVAHELEHSWNPRQDGESVPDYENRINQQAWAKIQADRAPGGIAGNRLQKLALKFTPMKQMEEIVPDLDAPIHQALAEMASDMAVQTVANAAGRPSVVGGKARGWAGDLAPQGGSVFQRALRWQAKLFDIRSSIRKAYLEDIGRNADGTRLGVEMQVLAQRIPFVGQRGQKTFAAFKSEVAAAQIGNVPGVEVSDAARRAAGVLNQVANEVEEEARKLGMFRKTKELVRRADRLDRAAARQDARVERMLERTRGEETESVQLIRQVAERQREEAAHLREQASQPVMQPGEERHYHRIYNTAALLANESDAIERLARAFARDGHSDPARAAEEAFHLITQDPTGGVHAPGTAAGLKAFELPWTNAEAFPYIVQDPELAYGIYLRRMGAQIEMTRSFGDSYALDAIDELRVDLLERGVEQDKVNQAIQLFTDVRDRIVGGLHGRDPLSWDNRVARTLKNVANLAVLGGTIKSQVSDIARFVGTQGLGAKRLVTGHGPAGLIGGILGALAGDIGRFNPGGTAKLAGEALELVNARHMALQIESDDAFLITRDTKFERALALAQVPFFVLNLMTPFTIIVKEMAGLVAAHNLIDEAKAVAAAIRTGAAVDPEQLARLAQMGFDRGDIQILADMPTEGGAGGLHLPNVLAWEGERGSYIRSKFLAAVNGEIRRTVVTPGPMDRPTIFDGIFHTKKGHEKGLARIEQAKARYEAERSEEAYAEWQAARRDLGRSGRIEAPLASLPFQLHSFAMASGAKVLHGILTKGERNRVGGILSLLMAGAFATWLKTDSANRWNNMEWDQFLSRTFESSNLGAWFTDVVKSIDTFYDLPIVDGEVDPNNASVRDEVGSGAGVAPGLLAGLVEPFIVSDLADARASGVRRILPFNNLIWWDFAVDRIERALRADEDKRSGAAAAPMGATMHVPRGTDGGDGGAFFAPDPDTMLLQLPEGQLPVFRPEPLPAPGPLGPLPPRKRPKKGRSRRGPTPLGLEAS